MSLLEKLGVYCIVALGLLVISLAVVSIWRGAGSEHWPVAEGEIVKSEVVSRSTYTGSSWRFEKFSEILYRYEVNNRSFEHFRIAFNDGGYYVTDSLAKAYPLGTKVRVYYDPDDPDNAVLIPGKKSWGQILGTALMGFCLTGIGLFPLWLHRKENRSSGGG